ncbi:hypothetical protein [Nocardia farcinica]|uniref:hypothetical protein n=1 Tax=Nocardia farcinica TaxID=37329 RepID=UPI002454E551|nr:hypothetical protein [Nocardia farcinica]
MLAWLGLLLDFSLLAAKQVSDVDQTHLLGDVDEVSALPSNPDRQVPGLGLGDQFLKRPPLVPPVDLDGDQGEVFTAIADDVKTAPELPSPAHRARYQRRHFELDLPTLAAGPLGDGLGDQPGSLL